MNNDFDKIVVREVREVVVEVDSPVTITEEHGLFTFTFECDSKVTLHRDQVEYLVSALNKPIIPYINTGATKYPYVFARPEIHCAFSEDEFFHFICGDENVGMESYADYVELPHGDFAILVEGAQVALDIFKSKVNPAKKKTTKKKKR